jgi:hypothetical protein
MYLIESLVDEFRDFSDRVLGREHTIGVPVHDKPEIWVADQEMTIKPLRVAFKLNRDQSIHTVYISGSVVGRGSLQTTHRCSFEDAPEWVRTDFTEAV